MAFVSAKIEECIIASDAVKSLNVVCAIRWTAQAWNKVTQCCPCHQVDCSSLEQSHSMLSVPSGGLLKLGTKSLNVVRAIRWTAQAWNKVKPDVIKKNFRKVEVS